MKKNKGFTLVELMVVIVIIGILAALAIPKLLAATSKAKLSEFKPTLKTIYTLSETYFTEQGAYGPVVTAGNNSSEIGYKAPAGGNFVYDIKKPAAGAASGTQLSSAIIRANKAIKLSDNSVLEAGGFVACVDVDGTQFASSSNAMIVKDAGMGNGSIACN